MTKNNLKVVKTDNKKAQEMKEKNKSLEAAISQIDQNFGKGSVMRLGQQQALDVEAISTGSLSLDLALGIGGLPKGRIIEIYGPESSGKTTLALQVVAEAQKAGGICAFVDAEHAMDPVYAKKLGVKTEELLISQPDTGEQALEITDTLIKSGYFSFGSRLCSCLNSKSRIRRRNGRSSCRFAIKIDESSIKKNNWLGF